MRLGLALPQYGVFAEPAQAVEVASAAETIGYDSLWVGDRILAPERPQDPYPAGDGTMPDEYRVFLDPIVLLTAAATATSRVRLGTSTLNALWQPPIMLARTLTALDLISGGRLDLGIGLGWMRDEYLAARVPWRRRGARLDETLDVLDAIWTQDVVEHKGPLWTIPRSSVLPKPAQRPRPPILLAGFTPEAMRRIGQRADGWLAVPFPIPALRDAWRLIRDEAAAAGRDPEALSMVVRANPVFVNRDSDPEQVPHQGTITQFRAYAMKAAEAGATELLIDLQQTTSSIPQMLDLAQHLHDELQ